MLLFYFYVLYLYFYGIIRVNFIERICFMAKHVAKHSKPVSKSKKKFNFFIFILFVVFIGLLVFLPLKF